MNCVLGQIKIAQQPDQRREDAPRLRPIKRIESFTDLFVRGFQSQSKLEIRRTADPLGFGLVPGFHDHAW